MKAGRWFRRALCGLLAMLLLAGSVPALAVGQSSTLAKKGDVYYVAVKGLHVHSTAEMSDNVIASLKKGAKIQFGYETAGWWFVRYSKYGTGFVDKQFLTRKNVPKVGRYKTTARLNVRAVPKTWGKKLGTLRKGAKLKVIQLNGDWVYIYYKGHFGWVAAKYLKRY